MRNLNIGCYWGGQQSGNYLLDIFYEYQIAFAYNSPPNKYLNEGRKGDIISITKGNMIVAIGKALDDVKLLRDLIKDYNINFTEEEFNKFNISDNVIGVKVKLYKLKKDEYFQYGDTTQVSSIQFISDRLKEVKEKINYFLKKYEGMEMIEKSIKLLKQNKNLILTGAPGTGKTYLAKQIAYELCIGNKNASEKDKDLLEKDFEHQCGFVQFHPSYDYTDFVEGLRPVNGDGDNIGFERRDGVFKEFCKRALKNYLDSNKKKSDLSYEAIIKKYLIDFFKHISNTIDNNGKYELLGLSGRPVKPFLSIESNFYDDISNIEENDNDFYIYIGIGTKDKPFIEGDIIEYINWYILFKERLKDNNFNVGNFAREIRRSWVDSYVCAFLLEFDKLYCKKIEQEKNNLVDSVELVERKNFVFIIDEINRGEISKIFGELFFSIDPGYRGEKGKVNTQYQNLIKDDIFENGFYIPENVYIIGTMNDIDRSVESMDFAMRRRFAWLEIKATDTQNMLKDLDNKEIIIKRMNSLNNKIASTEDLSKHYQIGASYFLKLEHYLKDNNLDDAFENLWNYHLLGILTEYLRGNPEEESILKSLKNAYDLKSEDTKNMNIGKEPQEVEIINNETQS